MVPSNPSPAASASSLGEEGLEGGKEGGGRRSKERSRFAAQAESAAAQTRADAPGARAWTGRAAGSVAAEAALALGPRSRGLPSALLRDANMLFPAWKAAP